MQFDSPETIRLPGLLGGEVVQPLEREIVRMQLAPGTKLVEDDIGRRFGVSRSPVREALQELAGCGLVERRPRRGMFVMPMTLARLDEIYICRVSLEALAAEGAARAATPDLVVALRKLIDAMAEAGKAGRREVAFDANVALTDRLHEHCRNETLQRLLHSLDKQALRYRYFCYREADEIVTLDVEANARLVDAIAARDPTRARAVTEALVVQSWALIRNVLADTLPAAETGADAH